MRVNKYALAPYNSTVRDVRARRAYRDRPFRCRDRGKDEFWTAYPQKRWHGVTNGYVYSHAVCCRPAGGQSTRGGGKAE